MPKPLDACLTIAGSDPSGGAGIQADLKTFTVLKVYGCAVITCLTAQNSKGVQSYRAVAHDFLYQQIRLVLDDLPLSHIKIGMVGSQEAAKAIGRALDGFRGHLIYDPVLKASDGSSLIQPGTLDALHDHVLSIATVITPNLPELQVLSGNSCSNSQEAMVQASRLLTRYPRLEAIILTGGHFPEESTEITDFLIVKSHGSPKQNPETQGPEIQEARHQRIKTINTHGTGCTFSAAITAYHLKHGDYQKAFLKTVAFMDQLLRKSSLYITGQGHGGLAHHLFEQE